MARKPRLSWLWRNRSRRRWPQPNAPRRKWCLNRPQAPLTLRQAQGEDSLQLLMLSSSKHELQLGSHQPHITVFQSLRRHIPFARDFAPRRTVEGEHGIAVEIAMHLRQFDRIGKRQR